VIASTDKTFPGEWHAGDGEVWGWRPWSQRIEHIEDALL
jgi:hypothetical protein